ncbi:hypothetical protein ADK57_25585 [Streptomyces sp. MMG1533]|uniref:hypothetical protein n=1 Tax=Streptomyces sp. MMG1533 TaxID=1415546 RepID=UPI0006AD9BFF|nr:hypothetical protein [Streptomyces sp. MMG1533]KOU62022.1 hypothetical protein ADK57_25585 [Streptomyces sp. MMG1533]
MNPDRFHVTLTSVGRPTMHGWWDSESTARGKVTEWIGLSKGPGARVTLVDEETGTVLTTWPGEA